jgi:hypothetical protein
MPGETILCIAPRDWNSLWRESQQIMSRLAPRFRVLYFDPGREPEHSMMHEIFCKSSNAFTLRMQEVQENLVVIPVPPSIPHAHRFLPRAVLRLWMPMVIKSNAWMTIRQVRWAIRRLKVETPILWLYGPFSIDLIGRFGEKLVIYYNYDEHADSSVSVRIKEIIGKLDDELTRRADIVFATSRRQWENRKAINPESHFIPNGVDYTLFSRALEPDLPVPGDIAVLPRPIIGFAGWLGFHIDVTLLLRIAETFDACSLVLVGPDRLPDSKDYRRLRSQPNVHFLGQKAMSELPNYLKAFDVALMPWLLTGHVLSAYPLKLHEYLAAGRAIVATALPELQPFSHVVRIAETHEAFIAQIREAIEDHSPQAIAARLAVARENTWDQRVEQICRILQPLLREDVHE